MSKLIPLRPSAEPPNIEALQHQYYPVRKKSASTTSSSDNTPWTGKMSMFRSKRLELGCFVNVKVLRDHAKRKVFAEHETDRYEQCPQPSCRLNSSKGELLEDGRLIQSKMYESYTNGKLHRQALRHIIRNLTLPARTRAQAQLQLTQMHCYTRPTQIRNRCIEGGKGRGVLRDFRMTRVCTGSELGWKFSWSKPRGLPRNCLESN